MKNILIIFLLLLAPNAFADRTGTIISAPVTVGDSDNTFPSAYQDEIAGGYYQVADITARDAITSARRVIGMLAYVVSEGKTYRLVGGITNSDWVEVTSAAGTGWTESGTNTYLTNGGNNVGVGTALPITKLQVDGTATANAVSIVGGGTLATFGASGGIAFDSASNPYASPKLLITTGGNVGIGTTLPAALLDVQGSAIIAGTSFGGSGNSINSTDFNIDWSAPVAAGGKRECSINLTNNQCLDYDYESVTGQVSVSAPGVVTQYKYSNLALLANQLLIGGVQYGGSSLWDVNLALIAAYALDDNAATTTVLDSTGSNNGTASTTTDGLTTPGKLSSGLSFTSASSNTVNLGTGLNQTGSFAVEFWMNTTSSANLIVMGNRSATGSNVGWRAVINNTANKLLWTIDTGATTASITSSSSVNSGSWIHVVGNYTSTQSELYINGVLEGTSAITGDAATNAGTLYLGVSPQNPTLYYQGKLDHVRFYNRALTQTEISGVYNAGTGTISLADSTGASQANIIGTTGSVTSTRSLSSLKDLIIEGSLETQGNQFINGALGVSGNVGIGTLSPVNKLGVAGSAVIGSGYVGSQSAINGLSVQGNVAVGTVSASNTLAVVNGGTALDVSSAIVSFYKFEDNAGSTTVTDVQGTNTGTASGNTSTFTTTGKLNNGFSFSDAPRTVDLGSGSTLKQTGAFSVAFWMNTTDTGNHIVAGNRSGSGTNVGWEMIINRSGSAHKLFWQVDTGASIANATSSIFVDTGNWLHAVGVYDGAQVSLYINGALEGTPSALTGDAGTNAGNTFLGKDPLFPTLYYIGKLDNFQVYNRALTPTEITNLYNQGNGTDLLVGAGASESTFFIKSGGTANGSALQIADSSGTVKLNFKDNGNLGIGTISPVQALQVIGTVKATSFVGDGSGITGISGGSSQWQNGAVGINTTSPVGIGTVAPISQLQVIGTVNATAFVGDGAGLTNLAATSGGWTDGGTSIYNSTTTDKVGIGTFSPLNILDVRGGAVVGTYGGIATAPGNGLAVSGTVGIGTHTPAASLDVLSTSGSTTGIRFINNSLTSGNGILFQSSGTGVTGWGISSTFTGTNANITGNVGQLRMTGTTGTPNVLYLENRATGPTILAYDVASDTSPFILDSAGNVGIGTSKATSPLTIFGTTVTQRTNGANTACSTTCGSFACYGGFDTALATGDVWVDCADATADKCQCSK